MSIEYNTKLIVKAAEKGNLDEVRRLIRLSDSKSDNSTALQRAAAHGHTQCVALLIPVSNPKANKSSAFKSSALMLAAANGHTRCVELLIPVSDPNANGNWALKRASEYGHAQCVDLLIQVSNPKYNNSEALRLAVEKGQQQCVDLLYPVSNPVAALIVLKEQFPNNPEKWMVLNDMIEAERLNNVLNTTVGDLTEHTNTLKVQRKM